MPRSHREDGAGSDEVVPPEMIPIVEAGGGVSEGFELSEADHELVGEDAGEDDG